MSAYDRLKGKVKQLLGQASAPLSYPRMHVPLRLRRNGDRASRHTLLPLRFANQQLAILTAHLDRAGQDTTVLPVYLDDDDAVMHRSGSLDVYARAGWRWRCSMPSEEGASIFRSFQ